MLTTQGLIVLYQLDCTTLGGSWFYFTSATDFDTDIIWGGQYYSALPMEAQGFEMSTHGAFPAPTVSISNLYGAGNLLLDTYRGLVGADLVRILTLRRFLDDGDTPDPVAYITRDKFTVAQKLSHTAVQISFKLAPRMDVEGTQLPRRQILRDICSHTYRRWDATTGSFDYSKASCPYTDGRYFDVNNQPYVPPSQDQCQRTFGGCSNRFGGGVLPARFFPGVGKVK